MTSFAEKRWSRPVVIDEMIVDVLRRESLRDPARRGLILGSRIRRYRSGGQSSVHPPYGIPASHLLVETQAWVAPSDFVRTVVGALETTNLSPGVLVPRAAAASEATTTAAERKRGVLVIAIGHERSDVAVHQHDQLSELFSVAYGQRTVLTGLAGAFNVSESIAERIDLDEMFRSAAGQPIVERARAVLRTRQRTIFVAVKQRLEALGVDGSLAAGAVLTGPGAKLPDVVQAACETFGMPSRLGPPSRTGDPEPAIDLDGVAAIGAALVHRRLVLASEPSAAAWNGTRDAEGVRTLLDGTTPRGRMRPALARWLREFIPADDST